MDLENSVLEKITPSPETVASIKERADRLKGIVEGYIAAHGIEVEARFAGSFSKGTFLSNPDLDLFLMFPDTVSEQEMRLVGLQAGEDILHGIRMFSDHPYTRGVFEGLDVDMVPCFHIDSTEHLKSAVDRTPFHTEFVNSRLDDAGRGQVRLLKKFMKGIGAYGAEQDSRGFSGYLCELLVIRFGSFRGVLEAARHWRSGTTISVKGTGPEIESALVVYDPVDPKRNVASAVHVDTLSLFIVAACAYLDDPREEFFFPRTRTPVQNDGLRRLTDTHGSRLLSVVFDRPDAIEDNLHSQLWKTQIALARKLDDFGFGVLRATHEMTDDRMMMVFELERDTLPLTFKHQGPPVWVNSTSFLSKWRGGPYGDPFIEDGRWVVISERQYTDARSMVEREAPMAGIGKELDLGTMAVMDHESSLANIDPLLLTELLDPKMPWEI